MSLESEHFANSEDLTISILPCQNVKMRLLSGGFDKATFLPSRERVGEVERPPAIALTHMTTNRCGDPVSEGEAFRCISREAYFTVEITKGYDIRQNGARRLVYREDHKVIGSSAAHSRRT